jgi:hypothetical protein
MTAGTEIASGAPSSFDKLPKKSRTYHVRLDVDARQIGLIDHNHSTESDFVKQLIEAIERETASVYGAKAHLMPRKTRWTDCLGP